MINAPARFEDPVRAEGNRRKTAQEELQYLFDERASIAAERASIETDLFGETDERILQELDEALRNIQIQINARCIGLLSPGPSA